MVIRAMVKMATEKTEMVNWAAGKKGNGKNGNG